MFSLDFTSRKPIYEQVYESVIRYTALGAFAPDDKLPTVRAMAAELGINPNTVAKAYQMLERDGYIYSAAGRGSFISGKLSAQDAQRIIAVDKFTEAVKNAVMLGVGKEQLNSIIDDAYKSTGGGGNA